MKVRRATVNIGSYLVSVCVLFCVHACVRTFQWCLVSLQIDDI